MAGGSAELYLGWVFLKMCVFVFLIQLWLFFYVLYIHFFSFIELKENLHSLWQRNWLNNYCKGMSQADQRRLDEKLTGWGWVNLARKTGNEFIKLT